MARPLNTAPRRRHRHERGCRSVRHALIVPSSPSKMKFDVPSVVGLAVVPTWNWPAIPENTAPVGSPGRPGPQARRCRRALRARVDGREAVPLFAIHHGLVVAAREPPGVLQVRVRGRREARHVGGERRDRVVVARWRGRSGADCEQSSCEHGRERGRYETLHGLLPHVGFARLRTYAIIGDAVWRSWNTARRLEIQLGGVPSLRGVRHVNDRTDAELIQAAESEAAAFAELYRRHVSTVHAWFRRRLEWAASDLTAEAFAQAWLSRRSFRDEADGSALPWLFGIARNVARESARRNEVETRRVAGSGSPPTSPRRTVTRR